MSRASLVLVVLALGLALPAHAATDPFGEYRIPDHHWRGGSLGLTAGGRRYADWDYGTGKSNMLNASGSASWAQGWDSDALQYSLWSSALGSVNSGSGEYVNNSSRYSSDTYQRSTSGMWSITGSLRLYPFAAPVGLDVSASAYGTHYRNWSAGDGVNAYSGFPDRSESHYSDDRHAETFAGVLDFAVGVGRVRDATVVNDAHRIEVRLLDAGALTQPLTPAGRQRLAALLAVAPEYRAAHERAERFVWRDLERILREDGALGPEGLDAYAVLQASEEDLVDAPIRRSGWFAGPLVRLAHARTILRFDHVSIFRGYSGGVLAFATQDQYNDHTDDSHERAWAGGKAEVHLPLGFPLQADAVADLTVPVRPGDDGLALTTQTQVTWYVQDRWSANAWASHYREYSSEHGASYLLDTDMWDLVYGLGVQYRLEDRLSIGASFGASQMRRHQIAGWSPASLRTFQRDGTFQVGLTYDFFRRLEGPGLIAPVLPVH